MPLVQQAHPDLESPGPSARRDHHDGLVELIAAHQAMVWRYLRLLGADGHEADDLMQDTFVVAAGRARRGDEIERPAPFLRGVARRLLLAARRRARRQPPTVQWLDAVDQLLRTEPGALRDDRLDALRACIDRLKGRMRRAVETHHLQGVPCREVARRLGIGAEGVKSLLARARKALRECVQSRLEQESP